MGNKWVELRNQQVNAEAAKTLKAMRDQQQQSASDAGQAEATQDQARIEHLERQVAALEARVQWAIDAIQHLQRQA